MSKQLGNINLLGIGEIQNANIQNLATAPTTNLRAGRIYFNTTDSTLYVYNGTAWVDALSQGNYTFENGVQLNSGTRVVSIKVATSPNAGNVTLTADSNGLAASVAEASSSAKGIIEIATDSEASTGTSEVLAINPKQLAAATSGLIKLTDLSIDSGSANYLGYNNANGKFSAKVDTTVTASSTNLVTSGAVEAAIGTALTGALKYQGTWTATSQTDYSSITLPVKKGYMYAVSGTATIGGVEWNSGDYLVINKDVASGGTITSADVDKIDNTEASDIVRLSATQTLTNKTIDADDNTISDLTTSNLKSGVLQTTVRNTSTATDTSIPSEKAVASAIANFITASSTDTLTNKTIDADDNTISDLTTSNLKSGVLQTAVRDTSTAADTSIPSEKAVATALASKTGKLVVQNGALTASGGLCTWTISNTLGTADVSVTLYEVATNEVVYPDWVVTASTITVKINAAADIAADTYKAVIIG